MVKLDEQDLSLNTARENRGQSNIKSELRGRELIYIDTDDDITSLVEKIKEASGAVVALVPPKRIGVLQSVVNLRLLQRAAKTAKKHLAIVTTDPALVNLAAGLAIPVAKNINAQAKIPEVTNEEEISDVIEGNDIDVTNSKGRAHNLSEDKEISAAVAAIETDDRIHNDRDADGIPDDEQYERPKPVKKQIKIPNINGLRTKLLIGGGLAVVLIGFLTWALVFAPQATITIMAKTSTVKITKALSLIPSGDKDAAAGLLQPVVKQTKANETVEFEATGSKEVGEKATGTVAFCYNETNFNGDTGNKNAFTLPAGTRLYANNVQFTTDSDLPIEGGRKVGSDSCETYYRVKVTAVNIGEEGNIAENTEMIVADYPNLEAIAYDNFTGGSKRMVKSVQQSDIDKALEELNKKGESEDKIKDDLKSQMAATTVAIDNSFNVARSEAKITPAVNEIAENGKATASVELTYTLVGVNRTDLNEIVDAQLAEEIDPNTQKIYNNGLNEVQFSDFQANNSGYTVTIKTEGHVGPIINSDDVKKEAVGKKSEEIKAMLMKTSGVNDVSVTMSPFWINKAPAVDKITVNFQISE